MKFMFIIYALIVFIISNGLGKLFLSSKSKLYSLRSLLGFCLLIFVLQIGYYPMQFFQLSSNLVTIWNTVIITGGFIIGLIKFKKSDLFFLKNWEFYLLLILVFFIIKIIPSTEAGDDWFYMPLIMDNANVDQINSIHPRTGWDWNIDELWKYQGYYLFNTFFYKVQCLLSSNIDAIYVSFRSTFSLLMVVYSSIVIKYIENIIQSKKKHVVFLIKWCSIFLVGFLEWSHMYWGSFATFPTMFPLLIVLLNQYSKKSDALVYPIMVTNGAMLSLFSSALFLNVFLIFSFFVYEVFRRQAKFKNYAIMLLPTIIYICFFIKMPLLLLLVLIIYILIYRLDLHFIDLYLNSKICKYVLLILPVIFIIVGPLLGMDYTWNLYRLGYTFLLFNIIVCLFVVYAYLKKKKDIEPIIFVFLIFNIYFFNPLVCPFITTLFTTTEVYYRLFYITKNPIMIAFIFIFIYQLLNVRKILDVGFKTGLIIIGSYYSFLMVKNIGFNLFYSDNYDYLLREDKDCLDVGQYLNDKKDELGTFVWSIYIEPRQFNIEYKANTIRYPSNYDDKDILIKALYSTEDLNTGDFIEFKNRLDRENVDLLITFNNEIIKERLETLSDVVYQNDSFVIYKVVLN